MTHPPERNPNRESDSSDSSDRLLADFLHQNTPTPPPADPTLRSQILTEIAKHPHPAPRRRKVWWLVPPAVAAAVLVGWLWPRPAVLTADERLDLETYLISSWTAGTTIETDLLDDWLEDGDPDLFDEF